MYNIRYDPNIGVSKATIKSIPFVYSFCIEKLDFSWDNNEGDYNQKIYDVNKKCLI